MRRSLADIRRIRAETHDLEHLWSADARAVMEEAAETVRIEDAMLADLKDDGLIATYAPRFYERLKAIERRLTLLESDEEKPS
ncbi:hypothetical protein [Hansschlegelia zhihuaiae]|uniref:Uncharacterized protein n=1 Tax=Hansschlegelia zhihuaiae TaxID=405005 RepID=A0A4Q0MHL9_9HYPH|nr:hypothetical protein [Hansschlegelia zhihuaiae]RXF73010.1 hypothetical protein EK403_12805 [Hansschlegelia zhihuaiae]